jgi:hypothetical protein
MDAALGDIRTLRSIAAILVSLAMLCERAGGRSFPVRWLVIGLLRTAEAVAREFVADMTQTDWPCLDDDPAIASRPVDATLLALRFRALAAMIEFLVDEACHFARWHAGHDRAARRSVSPARRLLLAPEGMSREYHDTS